MNPSILSLATHLGSLLRARAGVVTTAESCTGGGIAEAITQVSGASSWFECGFVTYSNASKTQILGVDPAMLCSEGAVSEAVVQAMAAGAMELTGSTHAIAVSGVAGPGGGSQEKPVGTVWLAWGSEKAVRSERRFFCGDREAVRQQAVVCALQGLIQLLCEEDRGT